jgi:hypothetical protein
VWTVEDLALRSRSAGGWLQTTSCTAIVLDHLGDTRHGAGDPRAARGAWQQALAILDDIHHPDAETIRAKLSRLPSPADP